MKWLGGCHFCLIFDFEEFFGQGIQIPFANQLVRCTVAFTLQFSKPDSSTFDRPTQAGLVHHKWHSECGLQLRHRLYSTRKNYAIVFCGDYNLEKRLTTILAFHKRSELPAGSSLFKFKGTSRGPIFLDAATLRISCPKLWFTSGTGKRHRWDRSIQFLIRTRVQLFKEHKPNAEVRQSCSPQGVSFR